VRASPAPLPTWRPPAIAVMRPRRCHSLPLKSRHRLHHRSIVWA